MQNSQTKTWRQGLIAVAVWASAITGGSISAGDSVNGEENCKVRPGDVNWHPDFDSACQAAAKSGRPVLLFQMMGKLDERFT